MKVLRLSVIEPYLHGDVALKFVEKGSGDEWRGIVSGEKITFGRNLRVPAECSTISDLTIGQGRFVRVRQAIRTGNGFDTAIMTPIDESRTDNLDLTFIAPHYTLAGNKLVIGKRKVELSKDPNVLDETRRILDKYSV
jgi:hypothetical protein